MVNEDPNQQDHDGTPSQTSALQEHPNFSAHPSVSIHPSVSAHPSVSIHPSVSVYPSISAHPSTLAQPSGLIQPSSSGPEDLSVIKVSKRRWAVVLVFSCYSMCNAFQWIQYAAINNIFMNF